MKSAAEKAFEEWLKNAPIAPSDWDAWQAACAWRRTVEERLKAALKELWDKEDHDRWMDDFVQEVDNLLCANPMNATGNFVQIIMEGGPVDGQTLRLHPNMTEMVYPPQPGIASETAYAFSGRKTEDGMPIWEVKK